MVHEDRGDFKMKVKGIESAHSGAGGRGARAGPLLKRNIYSSPRHPLIILFLVVLLLAISSVQPASSALADDPYDKQKEKTLREARKATRGGKYEKALELYRELLSKDAQDMQARLGISLTHLKAQNYLLSFEHAAE